MSIEEIAASAMRFVNMHWYYFDNNWGRVRCRFCGSSGPGYDRDEIVHASDCGLDKLNAAYNEEVLKRKFLNKLEEDYGD